MRRCFAGTVSRSLIPVFAILIRKPTEPEPDESIGRDNDQGDAEYTYRDRTSAVMPHKREKGPDVGRKSTGPRSKVIPRSSKEHKMMGRIDGR
jgi:hypothetical protein